MLSLQVFEFILGRVHGVLHTRNLLSIGIHVQCLIYEFHLVSLHFSKVLDHLLLLFNDSLLINKIIFKVYHLVNSIGVF